MNIQYISKHRRQTINDNMLNTSMKLHSYALSKRRMLASPGLIEALAEEEVLLLRLRPIIRLIGLSKRPEKKLRLDPLGS